MIAHEAPDFRSFSRNELTECPRERLLYHVVAIVDEQPAHRECARGVSSTAARRHVQRDRAHEGRPSPPAVARARPPVQCVLHLILAPRGTRDKRSEHVDGAPAVHALPEPAQVRGMHGGGSRRVRLDQLTCDEAVTEVAET